LVKIRQRGEESFGFELNGVTRTPGDHCVDNVESDSPADRAGVRVQDKVTHVNGTCVENYTINSLIDLLDYETNLNENKLNLILVRKISEEEQLVRSDSGQSFQKNGNKRSNFVCLSLFHVHT
jgi:C-terminal processing protease CtpA/Prc